MQYYQKQIGLGSNLEISIVSKLPKIKINLIYAKLWKRIYSFERQFSRFIPSSELSLFNKQAGTKTYISPEFKDILIVAKDYGLKTNGLFNPFILPVLQRAGYLHSMLTGYQEDIVDDYRDRTLVNIAKLSIGDEWALIPYGTALDLGGLGKGYLADRLADYLDPLVDSYWISLGGDIVFKGHNSDDKNWTIDIANAQDLSNNLAFYKSKTRARKAIATSSVGSRKITNGHHIIDPRTLKPSDSDVIMSTIVSNKCVASDILASCCLILGSLQSKSFLKQNSISDAILQISNNNHTTNVISGKHIKLYNTN